MVISLNPANGQFSTNTNPPSGTPPGFPVPSSQLPSPRTTAQQSEHALLVIIARELRIANQLLAQIANVQEDLDQWRVDPGYSPNLYPIE